MTSTSALEHEKVLALLNIRDDAVETEDDKDGNGSNAKPWQKFMNSMFMLMYLMSKSIHVSTTETYVLNTVTSLQMISFAFMNPNFQWNSSFREAVSPFFQMITFELFTPTQSNGASEAVFYTIITVLGIIALLSGWVGRQAWAKGAVHFDGFLPVLQILVRLVTTILFVPTLIVLLGQLDCAAVVSCDSNGARIAFSIFIILVLVIFVMFSCFVALAFVDNCTESENAMSQVHGRVDCASLLVKTGICVLFSLLPHLNPMVLACVVFAGGAALTGMYFKFLPYLHASTNRLTVTSHSAFLWAGACLVLAQVLGNSASGSAYICFLMGLPLMLALSAMTVIVREAQLSKVVLRSNISVHLAEIVLRYKFKPSLSTWNDVGKQYRKTVDDLYPNDPFLLLNLSSLFESCGENSLLSGQYVRRANQIRGKSVDHRFFIYRSFKRQQEFKNGTAGAVNYMTLKHHQMKSETYILESVSQLQTLYKLLSTDGCTAASIFSLARKIKRSTSRSEEHLTELIKITKSSPRSILLYALYAKEIQNDSVLSRHLTRTAKSMYKQGHDEDSTEGGAIFTISGDESSLGVIITASENMESYFGYTADSLVGKNIDYLCPPPFDNGVHERFLRHYIENAVTLMPIQRKIWARHVEGYTSRMDLNITPVQDQNGNLTFQGKLTRVLNDNEFVAIEANGNILFFSQGIMSSFGMRAMAESQFSERNIHKFIPQLAVFNFPAILEQETDDPKRVIDVGGGESYTVSVAPVKFPAAGVKMIFVEFQVVVNKNDVVDDDEKAFDGQFSEIISEDESEVPGEPGKVQKTRNPTMSLNKEETDDMQSVASDSTFASGYTSVMGQKTSLIHHVVQQRIEQENVRLLRFKKQCVGLAAIFCGMVLGIYFLNASSFARFHDELIAMNLRAQRSYLVPETTVAMLYHFKYMSETSHENSGLHVMVNETLASNADKLESLQELILQSASFNGVAQRHLMYAPELAEEFLADRTTSKTSLANLLLRYISNTRAFQDEDSTSCGEACHYVISNGPFSLVENMLESMKIAKSISLDELKNSKFIDIAAMMVVGFSVLMIMNFMILPPLLDVKRVKEEMSGALSLIPRKSLKKLARTGRHKFDAIKQDISRINTSNNPFIGTNAVQKRENNFQHIVEVNTASAVQVKGVFWLWKRFPRLATCLCRTSKIAPSADSMSIARNSNFTNSFVMSFVKLVLPLTLIFGYFVVVFFIYADIEHDAILHLNSIHARSVRWTSIQRMYFSIEFPGETGTWSRWNAGTINETERALQFLHDIEAQEQWIKYGSNSGTEVPLVSKDGTPKLYDLMYRDGCSPVEQCVQAKMNASQDGLVYDLSYGLDAAMSRLIQKSHAVLRGDREHVFNFEAIFSLSATVQLSLEYLIADIGRSEISSQNTILAGSLFCLVLVILVFLFMIKLFNRINDEVVDAQSMLLLLPADLIESVPSLKAMIETGEQEED